MTYRIDQFKSFKKVSMKPYFLSKFARNIFFLVIVVLVSLSCDSDEFDSVELDLENELNLSDQGTSESITGIFLDDGFSELNEALQYVNEELYTALVERFATGLDQHTVFAPNNEAFYKLYDCLGMQSKDITETGDPGLIRDILQYHVLEERRELSSLVMSGESQTVKTFYGSSFTVKSDGSIEGIVNASFIDLNESNKLAFNGVVHVVTEILLPIELACKINNN